MPSLKVPRTWRTNTASSISSARLNASRCGTVDSPTPTVPISSDSTSRMAHSRPSVLARAAAAIQPALPPPTMTILLRRASATEGARLRFTHTTAWVDRKPLFSQSPMPSCARGAGSSELGADRHAQLPRHSGDIAVRIVRAPDDAVRPECVEIVDIVLHVEDVEHVEAQVER